MIEGGREGGRREIEGEGFISRAEYLFMSDVHFSSKYYGDECELFFIEISKKHGFLCSVLINSSNLSYQNQRSSEK